MSVFFLEKKNKEMSNELKVVAYSDSSAAPAAKYEIANSRDFYRLIALMIRFYLYATKGKPLSLANAFHPKAICESKIHNTST